MNIQKIHNFRVYFYDQYIYQKISWSQFISANFLLEILIREFPDLIAPILKMQGDLFLLSWTKEKNYLDLGITSTGKFVWKVEFKEKEELKGHLGFGMAHIQFDGNNYCWPVMWADGEKKKYFDYFSEKVI